ncbi:Biflaviolin synthase [Nocardia seriolae]|uniref:Biflaviolin synthase n=1 Tax=Nocardia seriolae TaxID=37332 RepID=A0ABC8AUJ7_9NOCA|nr:Biflaviolin synthase [Nocardia seriolae]
MTESTGARAPMYTPEFAADPHRVYRELRARFGALAPVELAPGVPATLVVGYRTAVRILNDPDRFPADPRAWQAGVPADCPVLPMMQWRPNALRSAGFEHARYRQTNTAGLTGIDKFGLQATVAQVAVSLINSFCAAGTADLVREFAFPLAFRVLNQLLGCPVEIAGQAAEGMRAIFEGVGAENGNALLADALLRLALYKRAQPGDDVTTRMLQHPAGLSDTEMVHQLATLYGAGIEPQQNLIVNTLLLLLLDDRFRGSALGGSLSTRDALDEVLFDDPPMANFCISFPPRAVLVDDCWLPAHQPVVISMAACNTDPAIRQGQFTGNRSHLAWGVGPHACPASSLAYLIAQEAVDQLLDALPEIQLAVPAPELTWRPGPFHRALTALPVRFLPSPPLPGLITLALYVAALTALLWWGPDLVTAVTPFAAGWPSPWLGLFRGVLTVAAFGLAMLLAVLAFTAVTLVIGQPFYEALSLRVDRSASPDGTAPESERSFGAELWISVRDSVRILVRVALWGILLFALGFVPVVGQTVIPVLGALVTGFFLTHELTAVALQRRGIDLRERLVLLRARKGLAWGFGAPLSLAFLVPFVAVFLMPGAVAGATLLARELLCPRSHSDGVHEFGH